MTLIGSRRNKHLTNKTSVSYKQHKLTHHHSASFAHIHENSSFPISYLGLIASLSPSLYPRKVRLKAVALHGKFLRLSFPRSRQDQRMSLVLRCDVQQDDLSKEITPF